MEDGGGLRILGHYQVKLVVDRYEKVEPHERIGYMSVSKALYRKLYVGGTFLVCCQWNRNMPEEARMWPAK
jgi:predicted adenine nucleotide alpha hydrolase (AANH) superfamily ATPase